MFRNYLAAALRNLVRNRLYAAINIIGLALGFAAAFLIAVFVKDELSYDKWIPDHNRTYLLTNIEHRLPGQPPLQFDRLLPQIAPALKLSIPSLEAVARLVKSDVTLRHSNIEANEQLYWADPEVFDVLRLPSLAGDLEGALLQPDSIVLTRSISEKYFGRTDVVGETIDVNRETPMTVRAVIEDLPSNSHLDITIIASARASISPLAGPLPNPYVVIFTYTYVRLMPGVSIAAFRHALMDFVEQNADAISAGPPGHREVLTPIPVAAVHLTPTNVPVSAMKPRGSVAVIVSISITGLLIVLTASFNFVNLMAARAAKRAAEVGVRKVSGAMRRDLIIQFLGESLLYTVIGMIMAGGLAELLSPALQTFLQRSSRFHPDVDPAAIIGVAGFAILLGILAGAYPAFVLSAFQPIKVLKSGSVQGSGPNLVHRILAMAQFAILIGLVAATAIIHDQLHFALNEGLRLDKDEALLITTACSNTFKDQVSRVAGVEAAACSSRNALAFANAIGPMRLADGTQITMTRTAVGPGFFELYGIAPVAGRLFADARHDELPAVSDPASRRPLSVIILNQAAVRKMGFASAGAAIGQSVPLGPGSGDSEPQAEIIGVVSDFSVDSVGRAITPTFFYADAGQYQILNVKLNGRDIPQALAAIDQLWRIFGEPRPITQTFLNQRVEDMYKDISRQGQLFAVFSGIAVFIAGLGLIGLAAFTAEHRTKEIGIRKVMGATPRDILGLVVWEFIKPVLWANIVAWPVSYFIMHRWLEGFAYHIDLSPWMFLAASALALLIAVLTVSGHALLVARAQPVAALRYE